MREVYLYQSLDPRRRFRGDSGDDDHALDHLAGGGSHVVVLVLRPVLCSQRLQCGGLRTVDLEVDGWHEGHFSPLDAVQLKQNLQARLPYVRPFGGGQKQLRLAIRRVKRSGHGHAVGERLLFPRGRRLRAQLQWSSVLGLDDQLAHSLDGVRHVPSLAEHVEDHHILAIIHKVESRPGPVMLCQEARLLLGRHLLKVDLNHEVSNLHVREGRHLHVENLIQLVGDVFHRLLNCSGCGRHSCGVIHDLEKLRLQRLDRGPAIRRVLHKQLSDEARGIHVDVLQAFQLQLTRAAQLRDNVAFRHRVVE
mmetsp:Transcript_33851/g.74046  ORF Transcript_33851/g.74046 Transcript_33851/m.74046 type:complete len:307 (+) Transcript_33851:489-1409(+)